MANSRYDLPQIVFSKARIRQNFKSSEIDPSFKALAYGMTVREVLMLAFLRTDHEIESVLVDHCAHISSIYLLDS